MSPALPGVIEPVIPPHLLPLQFLFVPAALRCGCMEAHIEISHNTG